jgi:hypothetical protein
MESFQQLAASLGQSTTAQQTTISGLLENTKALTLNTSAVEAQKASALSTAGSVASSFLGGGLGISPLLTGLFSLLGLGSQTQNITPQIRYAAPPSVNLTGAIGGEAATGSSGGQQVNIQVSAMDSKSFLDHSEDIAQAVRRAILNSSSLNDVIADL